MSGDAHHVTQPAPGGRGAELAMRRALLQAGADPAEVAYINAHATSTPQGDDIEQQAIARVFTGEEGRLQVEALKGQGHTWCRADCRIA